MGGRWSQQLRRNNLGKSWLAGRHRRGGAGVTDHARERGGVICDGALGVGGVKMKIHKAAVRRLFTANDQVLDAETIFEIGRDLSAPAAS